jgi:uncharacterized protein (DUF1501 family)
MERRSFLKLAGLTGLALAAPTTAFRAEAAAPFAGPFLVQVNAAGAWDPNFHFNPTLRADHNRLYTQVRTVGRISCAPLVADPALLGLDGSYGYEAFLMTPEAFLTKYGARMTVIHGIDTTTNNHESGSRAIWSGKVQEGLPAIGALYASAVAAEQPVPYLSGGGFDATADLVPLSRVTNAGAIRKIGAPNVVNPDDPVAEQARFHTDDTQNRIYAAQFERLKAQRAAQRLPRAQLAMGGLALARANVGDLAKLQVPETLLTIPGYQMSDLQNFGQQAQLALAAFRSGVAAAASLTIGGFDTHSSHDREQPRQIMKLLWGIDYLMQQAQAAGVANQLVVMVGSDFGRGPAYNGSGEYSGKDHWPVTSAFAMGPGIPGDRVIGATDADQQVKDVDPASLATVDAGKGVRMKPEHLQRALRLKLGIAAHPNTQRFPLAGEDLPLFG